MEKQLEDIKEHEQKLMDKTMEFIRKIAQIEAKQDHLEEVFDLAKTEVFNSIRSNVTDRINDVMTVIDGQQKTLNKMLEIQGRQSEQISAINKTLEEFTEIRKTLAKHENRIAELERNNKTEEELRKEKVKGRFTIVASLIAAISAVVTALIAGIM